MGVTLNSGTRARLGAYLYVFQLADAQNAERLTSDEIGEELGVCPSQVRRDLAAVSGIGKRGKGYVPVLLAEIVKEALGGDATGAAAILIASRVRGKTWPGVSRSFDAVAEEAALERAATLARRIELAVVR